MINLIKKIKEKMKKEKECKLPDTLWELIDTALTDLKKCEQLPDKYRIDMWVWHEYGEETLEVSGRCSVCLAGAVLAQTCGIEYTRSLVPGELDPDTKKKLYAIDSVRNGNIIRAIENIHPEEIVKQLKEKGIKEYETVPEYNENKGLFKMRLMQIRDKLKKHNL